jgi:predicted nucleic acid-binding protein
MVDTTSNHHKATVAIIKSKQYERIIPAPVLPEVSYLLSKRMGYDTLRRFITSISIEKPRMVELTIQDYERVAAVMNEFADFRLDFADAAILTLAETMQIRHILTLDRRDFSVLRPRHCEYLELLP